jgi:hypothetical protein
MKMEMSSRRSMKSQWLENNTRRAKYLSKGLLQMTQLSNLGQVSIRILYSVSIAYPKSLSIPSYRVIVMTKQSFGELCLIILHPLKNKKSRKRQRKQMDYHQE